ncbi:MAG: redoxin domain-containing protein [Gammaproteobacteria bacterium]
MKWKLIGNLLGAMFLIAILVFAAYMLVPFVRYLSIPVTGGTVAPTFKEDPAITKIKEQNKAKYFDVNVLGNHTTIVPSIAQVPAQGGWINTAPLDLHGLAAEDKFILVNFCSYSDINCHRIEPYLEWIWTQYKEYGLVVIYVHTPELDFEKKPVNVLNAARADGVTYPIVTDAEKTIWNKFGNHTRPGQYLIDPHGEVVYTQFIQDEYKKEEQVIRQNLLGYGWELPTNLTQPTFLVSNEEKPQTPILYAGAGLIRRRLGNDQQPVAGSTTIYNSPKKMDPDQIYLSGSWAAANDYLQSMTAGQVNVNYLASTIYVVLSQAINPIMVEVRLDGQPVPVDLRGKDIIVQDGKTYMQIVAPGLYFPISEQAPYGRHQLTLLTPPGLRLYTFTFGVY